MALKFGAGVDNGTITKVLGLSEPEVMAKLRGALETLAAPEKPGEIHMK
jgi:hypothetical protein